MSRQEAVAQFIQANKLAHKYYKSAVSQGAYPYLPVLEDMLRGKQPVGRIELGLVDIPAELIIGTNDGGAEGNLCRQFHAAFGYAVGIQ